MRWPALLFSLLLSLQPAFADSYVVTETQLDEIQEQVQVMQDQIATLDALLKNESMLYQKAMQQQKRYKTLFLVSAGIAAGAVISAVAIGVSK